MFRRLQEGGVLYSTETEVYFGVGNVGAHIWEFLPPETRSFGELVARLSTIYRDVTPTQIRADVERFIAELLENAGVPKKAIGELAGLCGGGVDVLEWFDEREGRFGIEVVVTNRVWGPLFGYRGSFDVEWPTCAADAIPPDVRPRREERRE